MNLDEFIEEFCEIAEEYQFELIMGRLIRGTLPGHYMGVCPITAVYHHRTGQHRMSAQARHVGEELDLSHKDITTIIKAADKATFSTVESEMARNSMIDCLPEKPEVPEVPEERDVD